MIKRAKWLLIGRLEGWWARWAAARLEQALRMAVWLWASGQRALEALLVSFLSVVRIPANVTGHSGDRDRFAHGHHAGVGFVL